MYLNGREHHENLASLFVEADLGSDPDFFDDVTIQSNKTRSTVTHPALVPFATVLRAPFLRTHGHAPRSLFVPASTATPLPTYEAGRLAGVMRAVTLRDAVCCDIVRHDVVRRDAFRNDNVYHDAVHRRPLIPP